MTPTRNDLDDHDDLRELSRRLHDLADRWEVPAPSERPDPAAARRRLPAWLPDWVGAGAMVPVLAGLALVVLAIVASAWLADLGDIPDPVDDTPASSSILDLLGEVPAEVVGDSPIDVQLTDLATATRLAGMDRPTSDSSDDEYTAWLERLSGIESDPGTGDGVFAPFPTGASANWSDVAPWEDELGWSILDVDRIVEVTAQSVLGRSFVPPFGLDGRFGVVTGPAGQGDFPADLEDLGGGVVQAGDDASSLADSTPVRLQGSPLFLSRADGRLAYGSTEAMVRSWRDSTDSTLADDPDVAAAAAAVTTPDLTAARLERADFAWDPELDNPDIDPTELLPAPFDAIALGWSRDDQGLLVTVAYVHESAEDANRNAEELQRVWSSPGMPEGMASPDSLTIESVATDGRVATVRIRPTTPESSYQPELYLNLRGLPFVHAGSATAGPAAPSASTLPTDALDGFIAWMAGLSYADDQVLAGGSLDNEPSGQPTAAGARLGDWSPLSLDVAGGPLDVTIHLTCRGTGTVMVGFGNATIEPSEPFPCDGSTTTIERELPNVDVEVGLLAVDDGTRADDIWLASVASVDDLDRLGIEGP